MPPDYSSSEFLPVTSTGDKLGRVLGKRFCVLLCCSRVESIFTKASSGIQAPSVVAEKRDLLERLLARVAHEIRNPLSSLDVHVQLLEEDLSMMTPTMRSKLAPRFAILRGELHRLKSTVENFLRLTRPSPLELEPVQIQDVVTYVCEILRPEAESRGISFTRHLSKQMAPVMADKVRLTQVLLNLAINAMQAVGKNGRIEFRAVSGKEDFQVEVADNGPGVAPGEESAIFDPYFTTKSEGYGLGLWIAEQIATAHGGRLEFRNRPGGGALFTLRLPRRRTASGGRGKKRTA